MSLKEQLLCIYWNYFKNSYFRRNNFRIKYKKDLYRLYHPSVGYIYFYNNPYPDIEDALPGYFYNYKPKKGDTIIDCGSFIGVFSIFCSKLVGENGLILSYEPDDNNFRILKKNIEINNIKNIIPVKKGVWSKKDEVFFSDTNNKGNLITTKGNKKIITTTLDNEVERLALKKVDFLKMDIEGAEVEALKGSKNTIKNNPNCKLAIASYHIVNGEKTLFECEKILKEYGKSVETIYLSAHTTTIAK